MAAEGISKAFAKTMLSFFTILLASEFMFCHSYPLYEDRRHLQTVPVRRLAYFLLPMNYNQNNVYQPPDYDNEFVVNPQENYEYNGYEGYPYKQYFEYYPNKDYYRDKTSRISLDGSDYFEDQIPQGPGNKIPDDFKRKNIYPYGKETWYEAELPKYDSNAEANAAVLQNLIMPQMYQDVKYQYPFGDDSEEDYYDDQRWFYEVPVTEAKQNEKAQKYFKSKEDEDVKELEMLVRKINDIQRLKGKDTFKKENNVKVIEKSAAKPTSKMTDNDYYYNVPKEISVQNQKKNNKKQMLNPVSKENNFWEFPNDKSWPSYLESATNSIKKLNVNKNVESKSELGKNGDKIKVESSSVAAVSSTPEPKRPSSSGQKEVVLFRPSNPVRRPFLEISSRSLNRAPVYDKIKKFLNKNKDFQKSEISQPQKRFTLNDDDLITELSALKKSST